jgi:hypothetical protein
MTQRPVLLLVEDDEALGRMLTTMLRELADARTHATVARRSRGSRRTPRPRQC